MHQRFGRTLKVSLLALLLIAVLGVCACSSDSGEDVTTGDEATQEEAAQDEAADTSTVELTAEQEDSAIDIAAAYFVAQTDYTRDQFTWAVEAVAQDNDGQLWARVSATPEDPSLETEQIYVYSPAGTENWFAHDMGTGIDPSTDESFPEEVRDKL